MTPSHAAPILILGTSRFSEEVAEWVDETPGLDMVGFVENLDREKCGTLLLGRPVHWIDALASMPRELSLLCGLGTTRRQRYIEQVAPLALPFATLVHPSAHVAPSARVGAGGLIGPGAMLATRVVLADHALVNKGAIIGHHSHIGAGVTIGLGARLGGGCVVEDGAYIAMGAILLENVRVGAGALVSAGALVTHDVPAHTQVMGMPARVVREGVDGR